MFNLFDTGKADWITNPPAIVLRELLKPGRKREFINPKPMLCTYYYMLNTKRKPLDDVRVRKALALAINRERDYVDGAGGGRGAGVQFGAAGDSRLRAADIGKGGRGERHSGCLRRPDFRTAKVFRRSRLCTTPTRPIRRSRSSFGSNGSRTWG